MTPVALALAVTAGAALGPMAPEQLLQAWDEIKADLPEIPPLRQGVANVEPEPDLPRVRRLGHDDASASPDLPRVRRLAQGEQSRSASPPAQRAPDTRPGIVAGVATVIDGDTIEIRGQRIRLHGIDAPESTQTCRDASGRDWRCGQRAALELQELIGRRPVTCDQRDVDQYGRIVARCVVGELDVNEALVRAGLALAYRRYSRDYLSAENEARAAGRGMWSGEFVPPWEWRRR